MLKKTNRFCSIISIFVLLLHMGCAANSINPYKIYQYSTIQELLDAKLTGSLTFEELKKKGNHGIGTFNSLDGEMIMVNGIAYRASYDGTLEIVSNETVTPFAVVDYFIHDNSFEINDELSCGELKEKIFGELTQKENIYSIKIEGAFEIVNARSVKKPEKKGDGLKYVVENDNKFDLINVEGDVAGFWFPDSFSKINVPGFHFHFVSDDRKRGGHILNCKIKSVKVYIDSNSQIEIKLLN
ncbi:MAG: acetolactate decarboxylase [Thermodesulfobacteriota bacterium]